MHASGMIWTAGIVAAALCPAAAAQAASLLPPPDTADTCPAVDPRDTVDTVRASMAARLGAPIKEEAIGTQYVLTYRQRDGSQLFVTLTRDDGKLEATCETGEP